LSVEQATSHLFFAQAFVTHHFVLFRVWNNVKLESCRLGGMRFQRISSSA
jgi:hypothetical protein